MRALARTSTVVPVEDLAPRHEYHAGKLADVVEDHVIVLDTVGYASNVGMCRDSHNTRTGGALLVERIEVIPGALENFRRAVVLDDIDRDIVDLHRIGDRDERAALHVHAVGLVVVAPVADVLNTCLG